jgi:hypothetical protein
MAVLCGVQSLYRGVSANSAPMNPKDCFYVGPYTPPECIPWPQNDHEARVIAVIWLVIWTLGLIVMFIDASRPIPEETSTTIETEEPNAESVEVRS